MPTPSFFENIIANQFLKIPLWARIVTYFICLLVAIYQILFPKFIDGEIRVYNNNNFSGHFSAYRDAKVGIKYHGRYIYSSTDTDGNWALPFLDSVINGDIDLRVEYRALNGEEQRQSISVPRTIAITDNIIIGYNESTSQKFKILNKIDTENEKPNDNASIQLTNEFIRVAYAEDIVQQQYSPIKKAMDDSIGKLRKSDNSKEELTYSEKKVIQSGIEEKYQILLNDSDISQSRSADDLARLATTKILSKNSSPQFAYYGQFDSTGNWADRYFDVVIDGMPARAPKAGDIIQATGKVNIRAGYIEFSWFNGWENKEVIGTISPGDRLLVEEVKYIAGDFVWIKFYRVDQNQ